MRNCDVNEDGFLLRFISYTVYVLFSGWMSLHGFVLGLICCRLMNYFEYSQGLRWLPLSIKIACFKLCNFVFMYFSMIVAFGLVMHVSFGMMYDQFSSFSSSCFALLLFSFGMTDRAQEGMHPFVEQSGTALMAYLLIYTVVVITIALNFFTTIVLDAYSQAQSKDFNAHILEADAITSQKYLAGLTNIPVEVFHGPPSLRKLGAELGRLIVETPKDRWIKVVERMKKEADMERRRTLVDEFYNGETSDGEVYDAQNDVGIDDQDVDKEQTVVNQ